MENRIWIRGDRETGKETTITQPEVRVKVGHVYVDVELALKNACKAMPLTTGFADYWPKEK